MALVVTVKSSWPSIPLTVALPTVSEELVPAIFSCLAVVPLPTSSTFRSPPPPAVSTSSKPSPLSLIRASNPLAVALIVRSTSPIVLGAWTGKS